MQAMQIYPLHRTRILGAIAMLVALIPMAGTALQADEKKLTAAEIRLALTDNTVEGNWRGTPYRSYFAADGTTIYLAQGSEPTKGRWRADVAKGQYCSKWGAFGWDCYDIYSDGPGSIIWVVPSDGYRSPSRLIEGRELN